MNELRQLYLDISHQYFRGEISIATLYAKLKEIIHINVDRINLPVDERIMLIANHPAAEDDLTLPAENISGLKGGNHRNFPSFWFPVVRQLLFAEALGERRFLTLAHDIGWSEAMREMSHLIINHSGGGRCQEIISCMRKERDCSLVIFPEGGMRNLEIFHTGFFYIACALKIKYLVVGAFSPLLSLGGKNEFKIIHIEDMDYLTHTVIEFVDAQKHRIKEVMQM
ncbi:MAG: hypothetical protein WC823_01340 [Parcubacteria group bacterium]|jgi:hypothetical protein